MKTITIISILFLFYFGIEGYSQETQNKQNRKYEFEEGTRDPLKQPFSSFSIWNMPIGSNAEYIHARIQPAMKKGMTVDEDLIVMKPGATITEIFINNAGWNREKDRCTKDGELLFSAPIPDDFVVSPETWDGATPNSGLAVLMTDGRTIRQTQPFSRCEAGSFGTSKYMFENQDIYGEGYFGAHGGSGLSAIGGALRVGELIPGAGPIKHVLKVNVFANKNLYYDEETKGYTWPAKQADSYAASSYGKERKDPVKECRMGALLALPPDVYNTLEFETEPAKILAEAFRDYGAYVVDDTAWEVYALVTEWGPAGRVKDEFEKEWGFPIDPKSKDTPWARDMDKLFLNLHVVNNNSSQSIGGGGIPRIPLAPRLTK